MKPSREDMDALVRACADKAWRMANLYYIVNKDGHKVLFKPNVTQAELAADLHGKDIILKARQLGITTYMCIDALDDALFLDDYRAAIIAHRLEDAKTIFDTKVKFPYDCLPPEIKGQRPTTKDSADALHFSNGSSISVTTSARSGTLQRLHISEFGKICANNFNKAREITTGSFPAAERGKITIESTAEGQEGRFFEMTQTARLLHDASTKLGPKDYRFHFFPWWKDPEYVYDPAAVVASVEDRAYFDKLRDEYGIDLTDSQRAWYVKTEAEQGGDMKREYPSIPDEAFEQAIEGAYFERQLAHAQRHGCIGEFPYDPKYPVNTFWDLGRNDFNVIWFHQHIRNRNRFIGYYENSGEYVSYYIRYCREWAKDRDAEWGTHHWPHDGDRDDLFLEHGRLKVVEDMKFKPKIVPRIKFKPEAIEAARNVFSSCDFDQSECALGIKRLRMYRKEWDDQRGLWRDTPRHDDNSHGADGFMTFATGWKGSKKMDKIEYPKLANIA